MRLLLLLVLAVTLHSANAQTEGRPRRLAAVARVDRFASVQAFLRQLSPRARELVGTRNVLRLVAPR